MNFILSPKGKSRYRIFPIAKIEKLLPNPMTTTMTMMVDYNIRMTFLPVVCARNFRPVPGWLSSSWYPSLRRHRPHPAASEALHSSEVVHGFVCLWSVMDSPVSVSSSMGYLRVRNRTESGKQSVRYTRIRAECECINFLEDLWDRTINSHWDIH